MVVGQRLLNFLSFNKILSCHQFSFVPGKSTTLHLIDVVDKWMRALEEGDSCFFVVVVFLVFMDF